MSWGVGEASKHVCSWVLGKKEEDWRLGVKFKKSFMGLGVGGG